MTNRARKLPKSVHTEEQKAFCGLMIAARRKAGLRQEKLAEMLGKRQSFVSKYENGDRRIDVVEFLAIAKALKADPIQLLRALIKTLR